LGLSLPLMAFLLLLFIMWVVLEGTWIPRSDL
jgi:hypothetical protein